MYRKIKIDKYNVIYSKPFPMFVFIVEVRKIFGRTISQNLGSGGDWMITGGGGGSSFSPGGVNAKKSASSKPVNCKVRTS